VNIAIFIIIWLVCGLLAAWLYPKIEHEDVGWPMGIFLIMTGMIALIVAGLMSQKNTNKAMFKYKKTK